MWDQSKMMRLSVCLCLLCQMLIGHEAYAKPDSYCEGNWSIEMLKDENYTPWHDYTQNPSYPVKLELKTVRPSAAIFTDNKGHDCSIGYINDRDNKLVVFKHCLKSSNPAMVSLHYKISCEGDELTGKIVSYKDLFKIRGIRIKK